MKKKMWFSRRDEEAVREIVRKLSTEGKAAKRTERVTLFFAADDEIVTLTAIGTGQKRKALLKEPGSDEQRPIPMAAFETAQEERSVSSILPSPYAFVGVVKSLCATYTGVVTMRISRHTYQTGIADVEVEIAGRTSRVEETAERLKAALHPQQEKSLYQRVLVHKS